MPHAARPPVPGERLSLKCRLWIEGWKRRQSRRPQTRRSQKAFRRERSLVTLDAAPNPDTSQVPRRPGCTSCLEPRIRRDWGLAKVTVAATALPMVWGLDVLIERKRPHPISPWKKTPYGTDLRPNAPSPMMGCSRVLEDQGFYDKRQPPMRTALAYNGRGLAIARPSAIENTARITGVRRRSDKHSTYPVKHGVGAAQVTRR
jgi:hypothetical protein